MNANNQRAERLLQSWLESEAPTRPPEGLAHRIDAATRSARPRPAWLARLEGHHMDVIQGGRRTTGVPRLGLVLAIIGLLIVAAAAAVFFGSRPQNLVVAPTSQATATAAAAGTPRPTAKPRVPEPGDPIPDDLIGVWEVDPGEYLYILRGPDPYCQTRYQTTQDCGTWVDANGQVDYADIYTLVDGKLRDNPVGRADCRGNLSTLTFQRTGDKLELAFEPGSCYTRDFPTMHLVGTGEGGGAGPAPALHWP
jgi:hypothetical protein